MRVGTRTAENAIWSYEIPGHIDASNQLKALFPQLAVALPLRG